MTSKCLQINTVKVLVHKNFEFGGFCTWPSLWACRDYLAWWQVWEKNEICIFKEVEKKMCQTM